MNVARDYGDWLSRYPWVLWGTLTFGRAPTINQVLRWTPRLFRFAEKEEGSNYWWVAVEEGSINGRLHAHCLMGQVQTNTDERLAIHIGRKLKTWWEDRLGWAKFARYDPEKGASYYIAKYCAKGVTEWQCGGDWPKNRSEISSRVSVDGGASQSSRDLLLNTCARSESFHRR